MDKPVTAYPFRDAINELRQENEKSGPLNPGMMDRLRQLDNKTQEQMIGGFREKHRELLLKLDDPDGGDENAWQGLCRVAEECERPPPDPKVFIKTILEMALVAIARQSEAKALDHVIGQLPDIPDLLGHMKNLVKVESGAKAVSINKPLEAMSREELVAVRAVDAVARLRELSASLPDLIAYSDSIKQARTQAPQTAKGGTPATTLFKESLSTFVYDLTGRRCDDQAVMLSNLLLDRKDSVHSMRGARRWRHRGACAPKEK
jgi:hypothetical protein